MTLRSDVNLSQPFGGGPPSREAFFGAGTISLRNAGRENREVGEDGSAYARFILERMDSILEASPFNRPHPMADNIRSIVPYANAERYTEMERDSDEELSRLMILGKLGVVRDMMVMISPANTYGCEELKANGHGCVFMPYVPQITGRKFHLFVKLHDRGSRYMGRYAIEKATTRAVGVKAWENLPLVTKHSFARITAARENKPLEAVPGILNEFCRGDRQIYLVPLFCGLFDNGFEHRLRVLSQYLDGREVFVMDRQAKRNPAWYL